MNNINVYLGKWTERGMVPNDLEVFSRSLYPSTGITNTHKVEILPLGVTDEDHIHGHVHKVHSFNQLPSLRPPAPDLLPPPHPFTWVDIDVTGYIGLSLPPLL